eukprot:10695473-Lingulodinium_polyedra.AAC.1
MSGAYNRRHAPREVGTRRTELGSVLRDPRHGKRRCPAPPGPGGARYVRECRHRPRNVPHGHGQGDGP